MSIESLLVFVVILLSFFGPLLGRLHKWLAEAAERRTKPLWQETSEVTPPVPAPAPAPVPVYTSQVPPPRQRVPARERLSLPAYPPDAPFVSEEQMAAKRRAERVASERLVVERALREREFLRSQRPRLSSAAEYRRAFILMTVFSPPRGLE